MSDFERLKQSVGMVLRAANAPQAEFLGTAFLFRHDGDAQYWFTCYHVVMDRPALFITFKGNNGWETTEASLVVESSALPRDVAVLKTTSAALGTHDAIALGDPYASYVTVPGHVRVTLYGYAPSPASKEVIDPAQMNSKFDDYGERTYALKKDGPSTAPLRAYVLHEGLNFTPGLSGSPVFYQAVNRQYVCLGMFAQIYTDTSKQAQNGIVLKFRELYDTAGTLIPFFAYADFLMVAIAAKKQEMIEEAAERERNAATVDPEWRQATGKADFYGEAREDWQPFTDRTAAIRRIVELLADAKLEGTVQLASDYFDRDPDELKAAIQRFRGTTFLLDPCSVTMDSVRPLVDSADICSFDRASRYWSLCCKERADRHALVRAAHDQVKHHLPKMMRFYPSHFHRIEDVETLLDWLRNRLVRYAYEPIDPSIRDQKTALVGDMPYPPAKPGF